MQFLDTLHRIRRIVYRRHFHEYVKAAWNVVEPSSRYIDGFHIKAICEHLQAIYEGKITDLVINIPPGCMKSLLCNVFFPSWVWTLDATRRFFHASYDSRLSTRDSVACRLLLESEWYRTHWPKQVEFTTDENQKTFYKNSAGGYRIATSVGGHGTGEHPHFILCDDGNNVAQAESVRQREEVKLWWTQTMSTRGITVDCRRVVIQQRLNEGDITGVCLEEGGYDHLCLEMRCEKPGRSKTKLNFVDHRQEGELLCPELISETTLKKLELKLGPYGVAGQLQQRPVPRKGGLFNVDKFVIVKAAPQDLEYLVRAWDNAASDGKGDWTAGPKMGKHVATGLYYILDVKRGQWASDERTAIQRKTADADRDYPMEREVHQILKQEPGSGGKDQAVAFMKLMAGHSCSAQRDTGPKTVRADPFSCQVNAGNVCLVEGEWNKDFIEECRIAPNGINDDQWDGAATCFNYIELRARPVMIPEGWTFGGIPDEPQLSDSDKREAHERMLSFLEMNNIN